MPDLLSGVQSVNQLDVPSLLLCDPSQEPEGVCIFEFEEGFVSYTGNSSGSFAYYTISDAHCINSTSVRRCSVGEWVEGVVIEAGTVIIALF